MRLALGWLGCYHASSRDEVPMKRLTWIIIAGSLAAGGCSSPDDTDRNAVNAQAPVVETLPPEGNEAELPANAGSDAGESSVTEVATNRIPAPIRGRWALVQADCVTTHGDAKGLLEISAEGLTFYESRGKLTALHEREPTRIVGDFAFSGEGLSWQRRILLEVQDNGQSLVRRDYGGDDVSGQFHYTRCDG